MECLAQWTFEGGLKSFYLVRMGKLLEKAESEANTSNLGERE